MQAICVIQARTGSSRLPGKVLKKILGKPMLLHQIERAQRSKKIDKLVVATSSRAEDDGIYRLCKANNILCFRGSLNDVLKRFYDTAYYFKAKHIIRLTGDCPLIEPDIIDDVTELHLRGGYDYTSNCNPPTYPDGLDVEVITVEALTIAHKEAKLPSEREHVTSFIENNRDRFTTGNLVQKKDLSHLRLTVDTPEDFKLVEKIYTALYPSNPDFKQTDIIEFLENNPELIKINSHFKRNEGYLHSLELDKQHHALKKHAQ